MGRSNRSAMWVQSRMGDADPRLRANAVEGLWGVETEEARELMLAALHDASNRVVGNALYGLYAMGESVSLAETIKLAAHPLPVFRATAAWVMGETGIGGFATRRRGCCGTRTRWCVRGPCVQSRASRQPWLRWPRGSPGRLSSLMLETMAAAAAAGPKQMRRVQVAVAAPGSAAATLRATHFIICEDGQPVMNYRLTARRVRPPCPSSSCFPARATRKSRPG